MQRPGNIVSVIPLLALAACTAGIPSQPKDFILYTGGMALRVHGAYVTPAFFDNSAAKPFLGRLFKRDEYQVFSPVVILSHQSFRERFHADPAKTIGNSIRLDGTDYTIIAVMPPSFPTPANAEFLLPKETIAQ